MLEMSRGVGAVLWGIAWQSSLFLALGLGASLVWRQRPARAHRALLLAIGASLATPLLTLVVGMRGWGILRAEPEPSASLSRSSFERNDSVVLSHSVTADRLAEPQGGDVVGRSDAPPETVSRRGVSTVSVTSTSARDAAWQVSWVAMAIGSWGMLGGLALLRLAVSWRAGVQLVRRARPTEDEGLRASARWASARLGLKAAAEVLESDRVGCPMIWCWGTRPRLLLPTRSVLGEGPRDWCGVMCHELAHWKRRDHLASLLGELLACALPWNPLAWWAKEALHQTGEKACDDWVLAVGQSATNYAESLIGFVPRRRQAFAPAAVTSRAGLVSRVRHILEERPSSPITGTAWTAVATLAVVLAASAIALAQAGPAGPKAAPGVGDPSQKVVMSMKSTARGVVLGPDGKPAQGARLFWLGERKPPLALVAIPKEARKDPNWRDMLLAEGKTDTQGRFRLEADLGGEFLGVTQLVVVAPGASMFSQTFRPDQGELTLPLAAETPVEGRVLGLEGQPVAGVRVTLTGVMRSDVEGVHPTQGQADQGLPDFWPKPQVTDRDGRFTMKGLGQGRWGTLTLEHPDYAVDEVNVAIGVAESPLMKAFEIAPVGAKFTHILGPARPVQGVVTDKATGKPLANVTVEMIPMRRHGGRPFFAKTDADGHYRVAGHDAQSYITTASPDQSLGYLRVQKWHQGWPSGAKSLQQDFALEKGELLRGTVVDSATKAPIAGASVVYQPRQGNPDNKNEYDLRSPVLCDDRGRFTITGLPGPGVLVVETPLADAIRVPLRDGPRDVAHPHGFLRVDMPKDGESTPVEVPVRRGGVVLRAKVLDPEGRPLELVVAYGPELTAVQNYSHGGSKEFAGGEFQLIGADPDRTYRFYFLQPALKLGTIAELRPRRDSETAIEVRLQKTASIHGTVVDADGSPASAGSAYALIDLSDGASTPPSGRERTEYYANLMGQRFMLEYMSRPALNKKGELHVDTLIPGARFQILAGAGQSQVKRMIGDLKAGEDRDLGKLTLEPRGR